MICNEIEQAENICICCGGEIHKGTGIQLKFEPVFCVGKFNNGNLIIAHKGQKWHLHEIHKQWNWSIPEGVQKPYELI